MIKKDLEKLLKITIKKVCKKNIFGNEVPKFKVERQEKEMFGDYSTNLPIIVSKIIKRNPVEIGEIIKKTIFDLKQDIVEKIEFKEPGFINFFLSKKYLQNQIKKILSKSEKFGQLNIGKKIKTNIEFISANPTGQLHIGNGRGAFWGDCLANILVAAGYNVQREYLINDVKSNSQIQALGRTVLGKDTAYLTEYLKEKIEKLKPLLKKVSSEKEAGFLAAKEITKDIKNFVEKKLKIKFDFFVSEERLFKEKKVEEIYQFLKKKGLVHKKEGAMWLKISKFGAPKDEVIIRKTGEPTYFLSDIAYHKYKFDRGFKKIINIWGADHQGHIPKIKTIAKIFGYKGELEILISQIVTLKGGEKLSKRKGKIITLEQLINEIGQDVARFFYLTKSLDTPMEFDFELAKEKSQKNPVFYIQYAFARICSLQRKLKAKRNFRITLKDLRALSHPKEINLIKTLALIPEIIEDCAKDYQLQRIPKYAYDLASAFHSFYDECRILGENKEIQKARIALILATKTVLKQTLSLMGISAPEKM